MILGKTNDQILQEQDNTIKDCKDFRSGWETDALKVELSYQGMKNPQYNARKDEYRNNPKARKPIVNILKRQVRSILNYFLNNEPHVSTRKKLGMSDADVKASTLLLTRDFTETDFYEEDMDNIVNYGIKRGVIYVLAYMGDDGKVQVKVGDSFDTYIDVSASHKKDIRKILFTFTLNKDVLQAKYPTDVDGNPIDWKKEMETMQKSENDKKNILVKEPGNKDIVMFREGWYMDYTTKKLKEGEEPKENAPRDVPCVVKVLSTKTKLLKKEIYYIDFLPVTYYSPINDPDNLFPQSWVLGVIEPEKVVNDILHKLTDIVTTGGRAVYVREGTRITKGTNKALQSLGLEIYEIGKSQDIPREAELLTISQSQMLLLDRMIREAEKEGGMLQDIMGDSSLGADASGRAIEALQAGSKGNVGMAMIELNKFMTRLAKIFFKLYQQGGGESLKIYDESLDTEVAIDPQKLGTPKLHIEPRSPFDDITAKIDGIEMLKFVKQFDPETKISADIIVEIFSLRNELAEKIGRDMKAQEDPSIKHAESCIQLLLAGQQPAVSETDDHEVHMAYLAKVIDKSGTQLPQGIAKAFIDKYNAHKAWLGGDPSQDRD